MLKIIYLNWPITWYNGTPRIYMAHVICPLGKVTMTTLKACLGLPQYYLFWVFGCTSGSTIPLVVLHKNGIVLPGTHTNKLKLYTGSESTVSGSIRNI